MPIGIAGVALGAVFLPEFAERREAVWTWPGLRAEGVIAIGALVYALVEGPARSWASAPCSPRRRCPAVAPRGVRRRPNWRAATPMLDLTFFRDRFVAAAVWGGFAVSFGMFGAAVLHRPADAGHLRLVGGRPGCTGLPATVARMAKLAPSRRTKAVRAPPPAGAAGRRAGALCAVALGGLSLYGVGARRTPRTCASGCFHSRGHAHRRCRRCRSTSVVPASPRRAPGWRRRHRQHRARTRRRVRHRGARRGPHRPGCRTA
ncbi:hypothetical protein ACU686_45070 [Yinghuangia aomiensis]